MTIKITATPITGRNLKPGDLFSSYGREYWDGIDGKLSIGERVYIRTNTSIDLAPDADDLVYLIIITQTEETDHDSMPGMQAMGRDNASPAG